MGCGPHLFCDLIGVARAARWVAMDPRPESPADLAAAGGIRWILMLRASGSC
jgi:hypothetical protein